LHQRQRRQRCHDGKIAGSQRVLEESKTGPTIVLEYLVLIKPLSAERSPHH
jgi:hypothetical protein